MNVKKKRNQNAYLDLILHDLNFHTAAHIRNGAPTLCCCNKSCEIKATSSHFGVHTKNSLTFFHFKYLQM